MNPLPATGNISIFGKMGKTNKRDIPAQVGLLQLPQVVLKHILWLLQLNTRIFRCDMFSAQWNDGAGLVVPSLNSNSWSDCVDIYILNECSL